MTRPLLVCLAALICSTAASQCVKHNNTNTNPFRPRAIVDPSSFNTHLQECNQHHKFCDNLEERLCQRDPDDECRWVCLHKSMFPMGKLDLLGPFAIFAISIMAGAAGIGGGGMNVPLLMFLLNFQLEEAVPLSHIAVFGNAISQNFVNMQRRHPNLDRPLIDYYLPVLLLPAQLGGNSIGVVIGKVFPPAALIILATLLLVFATWKTAKKGVKIHRQEKIKRKSMIGCSILTVSQQALLANDSEQPINEEEQALHAQRLAALEREKTIPWDNVAVMSAFLFLFACDFLLLSPKQDFLPSVEMCSALYWVCLLGFLPFCALSVRYGARKMWALQQLKTDLGIAASQHDLKMTPRLMLITPLAAAGVGLVAGLLGLGGGELMAPLLLELGLLPQVASATSAFMIIFTESSNLMHYLCEGILQPYSDYAVFMASLTCLGAGMGRGISIYVGHINRSSYIVFTLAVLLLTSTLLLLLRAEQADTFTNWAFSPFCPKS